MLRRRYRDSTRTTVYLVNFSLVVTHEIKSSTTQSSIQSQPVRSPEGGICRLRLPDEGGPTIV